MRDELRIRTPGILLTSAGLMLSRVYLAMWHNGGAVLCCEPNLTIRAIETAAVILLTAMGVAFWLKPRLITRSAVTTH